MRIDRIILFILIPIWSYALEVPQLAAPVIDQTQTLRPSTQRTLNAVLRKANSSKVLQMAVLIIPDLKDESLEGYSIKVVDNWKLGSKEKDNGILLLIAQKQRKIRIEVGQGLEGTVPDAYAARIIAKMGQFFQRGQFDEGVLFAVNQIFILNKINPQGMLSQSKMTQKRRKKKKGIIPLIIFSIIFILIARRNPFLAAALLSGGRGRGGFGGGGSSYGGGGGGFSGGGASGGW